MSDEQRPKSARSGSPARATGRHPSLRGAPPAASKVDALFEPATVALTGLSAPTPVVPDLVQIGQELGGTWRWLIDAKLGSGGYGAVYHARRVEDGSVDAPADEAAIKVFHAPEGVDPDAMLRRELSALLALRSDRIPAVLDWSAAGNMGFVAMQHFRRGSLWDHSQRKPRMKAAGVWRLLLDLLDALRIAHHAAVLHLDIKPSNVLVDDRGGFVLTDFGIAQGSYVAQVIGAAGLGTRGFQSPEQARREVEAIDVRTDLWGVGATAWAMITGIDLSKRPDVLLDHADPETFAGLPRPSAFVPGIEPALEQAILQLAAFDPIDRPGGAAEALAIVRRLLSGHSAATSTAVEVRGRLEQGEASAVLAGLLDPLWQAICGGDAARDFLVRYSDGELLCREGERSYHAYALLRGTVRIERGTRLLATIDREGTFLGEVSTLTGSPRTASMRAQGTVYAMLFNAAELEQFVVANPAVALRLVHSLCERLERESKLRS